MRRDSFVHCLDLNHFDCKVYRTPPSVIRELGSKRSRSESLHRPSDERRLRNWLAALAKPVAVFCANDMRAYQTIQACHALGIRVPEEVAVLGVDDELVCEFLSPTLSSIDPNGRGVGFKAAETLDRMLANPRVVPPPATVKPLRLVARGSTNIFPVNPPWLSSALVFIRSNITQKLTASDVYRHLGKSHTLVDTAFRNVLRSSVQKEINRQRLTEAKRLINSTDLPVGQVAELAGFASPQYFCAAFGKAFGQSPSAMRESSKPSDVSGEGRRARGPSKCA
jgi:LacI family transcriptional regulator